MNKGGMTLATALKISNISKKFGKRTVLDNVSFEAHTGEVLGLLGPNGAGKTTLIKLITGLLAIEDGEIEILGNSLEKNYEDAMRNLGAIVENPEMYKYMTGMQNIMQYARMRDNITKERIDEVVELVGLTNRIHEKVGKYSLGMRQRLGVALSLLHSPKILILDEPTNGLDPAGIKQLRDIVTNIAHTEDVCVMVSSHLMSEMELMCDRVAIISKGKLISIDSMENMLQAAKGDSIIYAYNVSDFEHAKTVIQNIYPDYTIQMADSNHFEIYLPLEDNKNIAASITASLIKDGIAIYSVIPKETKKLEDAFIEITSEGGTQIA